MNADWRNVESIERAVWL